MKKRILQMYISNYSGHHKASLAIEKAFNLVDSEVEVRNVNSFNYTNPILEKIITKTYMGVIRKKPEFWGYLYDNPDIVRKTQKLREAIHRFNTAKLKTLLDDFRPDAVVCTQAFPCGMIADYKKSTGSNVGLYGVLTDYAPHSYWIFDRVDAYFVPSAETGKKLVHNGVPPNRIIETGIPIDPLFGAPKDKNALFEKYGLDKNKPVVLMMGGSQGFGPLKEVYASILKSPLDVQTVLVSGKNERLHRWFTRMERKAARRGKFLKVFPYIEGIDELMEVCTILVSKPGGITTAEALVKGVAMVIINPIPGQEQMNTDYLLANEVAVKVDNPVNTAVVIGELLYNKEKLLGLGMRAKAFARPDSARTIAGLVLANLR